MADSNTSSPHWSQIPATDIPVTDRQLLKIIEHFGVFFGAWNPEAAPRIKEDLERAYQASAPDSLSRLRQMSGMSVLLAFYAELHVRTHDSVYDTFEEMLYSFTDVFHSLARNRHLPYREYLETSHWEVTRESALERASHRCQLCGSPHRLNVHHRSYERLFDEPDGDLIVLCRDCHAKFNGKLP